MRDRRSRILVEQCELDAVKTHKPFVRGKPEITIVRLVDRVNGKVWKPAMHVPYIVAIPCNRFGRIEGKGKHCCADTKKNDRETRSCTSVPVHILLFTSSNTSRTVRRCMHSINPFSSLLQKSRWQGWHGTFFRSAACPSPDE